MLYPIELWEDIIVNGSLDTNRTYIRGSKNRCSAVKLQGNKMVGVEGFAPSSRTNLVLTAYKTAVLLLNYTPFT